MNSLTQPVSKQSRQVAGNGTVKDWLDVLCSGTCDQGQFLRGVGDVLRKSPDSGWELLGLIDQYYRRGKLSAQTFGTLKTHLQALMVGTGNSDEVSAPPRMQGEPVSAPVTAATPVPPKPAPVRPPPMARAKSAPTRARPAPPPAPVEAAPFVAPAPSAIPAAVKTPAAARNSAPTAEAAPRAFAAGDVLRGRYVIQGLVGQGGMGTVYAAIDKFRLDRSVADQKVALKVLHTEIIKRPRLFAELRREFQHLQSLSHPNIVRVHEFDRDGDTAFFTMEYLSGALLSKVLSVQEFSALHRPYALSIIRDVGSAVAHAHARGVVHGDLNPANIFINDAGEPRVLDFGASHQLHRGPWISEFSDQDHVPVATRGFASCQVLSGETADARDDVFALACVTYMLLTGQNPFGDHSALKARTLQITPRRPQGLNGRQWSTLKAGLNFDRDQRPADVQDWLERLELRGAAPSLPPLVSLWSGRPRRRTGGAVWKGIGAGMVIAAAAWLAFNLDFSPAVRTSAGEFYHSLSARLDAGREWLRKSTASNPTGKESAEMAAPASESTPLPTSSESNASREPAPRVAPPVAAPVTHSGVVTAAASPSTVTPPAVSAGPQVHARIELAADNLEIPPSESMAHVVVRRTRNLKGDVSFSWWTESGTAKPGRDFVTVASHTETIENGQSAISLVIPLVPDPTRKASRSFYVVIDQPSDNAALGSHTLTMVTMTGTDPEPSSAADDQ